MGDDIEERDRLEKELEELVHSKTKLEMIMQEVNPTLHFSLQLLSMENIRLRETVHQKDEEQDRLSKKVESLAEVKVDLFGSWR